MYLGNCIIMEQVMAESVGPEKLAVKPVVAMLAASMAA